VRSPSLRGLPLVHVAGGPIGGWQGCIACHQVLPRTESGGWWQPGARVAEVGRFFLAADALTPAEDVAPCPGVN
jgi:hypothetical protein